MELLNAMIIASEKAANIARICRQDEHLFQLLIHEKSGDEANPRFVRDFKTLADVLIQEMVKFELGCKFPELIGCVHGEEDNIFTNTLGETIKVEVMFCRDETSLLLQKVMNGHKEAADLLANEVHKRVFLDHVNTDTPTEKCNDVSLRDLAIWVDPIDSTAEYINASQPVKDNGITVTGLACVTVLIGAFDKKNHLPVIGVVNQPFFENTDHGWKGKCWWGLQLGGAVDVSKNLEMKHSPSSRIVCVSSSENSSVVRKLKEAEYTVVEASGAGYKILAVITGLADAYVLTKDSTYKWDTCGPQAVLRAQGGDVLVYKDVIMKETVTLNYNPEAPNCNYGGILAYRSKEVMEDIMECLGY